MQILPRCLVIVGLTTVALCGCSHRAGSYTTGAGDAQVRDQALSLELFQKAKAELTSDPERAEALLRESLDADLFNGPAHNNLGVLLLKGGLLYQAAQEFEWARKLMPGHPDPRVNLAIVLESAQKHADAIDAAKSALEAQPGHLPAIQALALIQVQNGLSDAHTPQLLASIVERSPEPIWRNWAQHAQLGIEAREAQP